MAWLTGWRYRKSITVSRASGAVTNYQLKLLLGESSGATGESVDCEGHCLSSFNDLRFTASDGATLLDYWIESITGTTPNQLATIWVEFDNIGTDATTFYMYYGHADAAAASNGANTFIVFDDFERSVDGGAVGGSWTKISSDTALISTTQKYNGTRSGKWQAQALYTIPVTGSVEISVMLRAYKPDAGGLTIAHGDASTGCYMKWDTDEKVYYYNGSAWVDSTGAPSHSAWHKFEINNFDYTANTNDIWIDDVKKVTGCGHHSGANLQNKLLIEGRVAGQNEYLDCLCVRNWRATEPAWGSWGAEEMLPSTISAKLLTPTGWQEVWVGRDGVKTLISGGWF